jgi:hypothetical protein
LSREEEGRRFVAGSFWYFSHSLTMFLSHHFSHFCIIKPLVYLYFYLVCVSSSRCITLFLYFLFFSFLFLLSDPFLFFVYSIVVLSLYEFISSFHFIPWELLMVFFFCQIKISFTILYYFISFNYYELQFVELLFRLFTTFA